MASISGALKYDALRATNLFNGAQSAIDAAALPGIAGIPVVLLDTATGAAVAVTTDASGAYEFTNVPDGAYFIVEAFGAGDYMPVLPANSGDFSGAVIVDAALIKAKRPGIGVISAPPTGATHLDALTPTTIPLTVVASSNYTNQFFVNGPVRYVDIQTLFDANVSYTSPTNLITAADNGTFGILPAGTSANSDAYPNPYDDIGLTALTNVQFTSTVNAPEGGEYIVQNMMTNNRLNRQGGSSDQPVWWRVADHTAGDETGRMLVVNGDEPGSAIFQQRVQVTPDTDFIFSAWILNLNKDSEQTPPVLGVKILGADEDENAPLYEADLGNLLSINKNVPEWKQIGTVLNSGENAFLTVRFVSQGAEGLGNDYIIDDIELRAATVKKFIPIYLANQNDANVGDTITYTIIVSNNGATDMTNIFVQDTLPDGIVFVPGSVSVDNVDFPNADPGEGFYIDDIGRRGNSTITFDAVVTEISTDEPSANSANVTYDYSAINGGIPNTYPVVSMELEVYASEADLAITIVDREDPVRAGRDLIYDVTVINNGPDHATDVIITPNVDANLSSPQYSLDNGTTWIPITEPINVGDLVNKASKTIQLKGTVSENAVGSFSTTASVTSSAPIDPPENNTDTEITVVYVPSADIHIELTADAEEYRPGDTVTYTITMTNNGPDPATQIRMTASVPQELTNAEVSEDGINYFPWQNVYSIDVLPVGETRVLYGRGVIAGGTAGDITASATATSVNTADPYPIDTAEHPQSANDASVTVHVEGEAAPSEITYAANDGTGYISPEQTIQPGDTAQTYTPEEAGVSRPGYAFIGWNTAPDGSGVDFTPGAAIQASGDMTLYAQWTQTLTYDANGGVGAFVDDDIPAGEEAVVLSSKATGITRDGYTLLGWSETPDAEAAYGAGDFILPNGDATLYAVWAAPVEEEDEPITPPTPEPTQELTREAALNQVLSSIAQEELSLSHILNAEGEKLQYVLGTLNGAPAPQASVEQVLAVNASVQKMLDSATASQMFLLGKMVAALE